MISKLVQYLHAARIPFRLTSYPSEEAEPLAAHPMPPHSVLVDSMLATVNQSMVLVCYPAGERIDLVALGATLGGVAVEASLDDLPSEFQHAGRPVPPLGQLLGVPIVLDERVTRASTLVFKAFGQSDYFELPYADYARFEQPRIATLVRGTLGTSRAAAAAHN
jgi:prolyl-tRNA editing enzyme YbaK/EbsC (Cys-tRNA(Pro) deacylase)